MTRLIFGEYSLAWGEVVDSVTDTDTKWVSALSDLPKVIWAILGKAKGRIHGFGIAFWASPIPLSWQMSNWENRKMGLDSTKTYASFYALIKNINNRKNVSFQSVSPWQWWSSCHFH